ncbi:MAG: hypothetical protein INF16_07935 [Methylobacterium sp.]|nr:hypothetical protein [Methylobacterium sp.]
MTAPDPGMGKPAIMSSAFSSEVGTGSRKENAIKKREGHFPTRWIPVGRRKCSRAQTDLTESDLALYLLVFASAFSANRYPLGGRML